MVMNCSLGKFRSIEAAVKGPASAWPTFELDAIL